MGIVFQNVGNGIEFQLTWLGIFFPKATAGNLDTSLENPIPTTIGNKMYLKSPRVQLIDYYKRLCSYTLYYDEQPFQVEEK